MTVSENIAGSETNDAGTKMLDSQRIKVAPQKTQPIPPASRPNASQDRVEIVLFDEIVADPSQSRSKIRVFAIMTALFVSVTRLLLKTISLYTW